MATARHQRAVTGEKPHCPQCEGIELRRQGRVGMIQRVMLPRLGLFPWECGLCRKVYLLRQRSTDYRQHSTEAGVTPIRKDEVKDTLKEAVKDTVKDTVLDVVPFPSMARPRLKTMMQRKSVR